MKTAIGVLLVALLATPAHAQLNGVYGATARGVKADGTEVQAIDRFSFASGALTSFTETIVITGPVSTAIPCPMSAQGNSLPYSMFGAFSPQT